MRPSSARNLLFLVVAVCAVLAVSFSLRSQAQVVTCTAGVTACPYVKAFGADVFAGGWFSTNTTNCAANYQNNQTSASGDNGGILTYANMTSGNNPAGGASS